MRIKQYGESIKEKHAQFLSDIEMMEKDKDNSLLEESEHKLIDEKRKFMEDLNRCYPKWKEFIRRKNEKKIEMLKKDSKIEESKNIGKQMA